MEQAKYYRTRSVGYHRWERVECTREQATALAAKRVRKYFQSLLKDGRTIAGAVRQNRYLLRKLRELNAPRILIVERSRRIAWLIAIEKLGQMEARMAMRKKLLKLAKRP